MFVLWLGSVLSYNVVHIGKGISFECDILFSRFMGLESLNIFCKMMEKVSSTRLFGVWINCDYLYVYRVLMVLNVQNISFFISFGSSLGDTYQFGM